MEENPKITGGLKEAMNKAAEDSIKGCCTEVYVESAVYHCLDLCITNPKIEGGAVTVEILSKMDPTKKSSLMDDLRKLSRDIIKEKAVDASLIHPEDMEFGQVVKIVSDGTEYTSILTGKEISETYKLIFGTVRLDLTKILRRN